MYDPAPGPGVMSSLSGGNGVDLGTIELVPSMGSRRYATFREIYLTNPWVWAACNILARGVGRTPTGVFAIDEIGNLVRQRGDTPQPQGRPTAGASLDKLLTNPTPGVSRGAVFRGTTRDKMIYGNGLWRLDRGPGGGAPIGVTRKPWRKVAKVVTDKAGNVLYYEMQRIQGQPYPERLLPADVVHFGLFEDEEAVAPSPLLACRATLALHDAVVRHLLGYFKNSARTSGHLSVDRLSADKAREVRDIISELYASPENAGKILVTSGKWERTSDSPSDSGVTDLVLLSREEVAAAYMIPPPVMGILDRAIKSNVETLRSQYIRDSLGPLATDMAEDIDAQLTFQTPGWSPLHVQFLFEEQLQPDPEGLALVVQREAPFLTVDEIRSKLGRQPLNIAGVTDVPWAVPGSNPLTAWENGNAPGPKRPTGPKVTPQDGKPAAQISVEELLKVIRADRADDDYATEVLIRTLESRNGGSEHDD